MRPSEVDSQRRRLLLTLGAAPFALALAPLLLARDQAAVATAAAQPLAPTPACEDADEPTLAQTAGPFYTPNSPERRSLIEPGTKGARLALAGRVLGRDCKPIAGALVDFWQSDDDGDYDNEGYRLRGHQFTDAAGAWSLTTIVPGLYTGRTRHIHVRVQPRGGRILTTQLYFPGEAGNKRDGLFDPRLLLATTQDGKGQRGRFDFVVNRA